MRIEWARGKREIGCVQGKQIIAKGETDLREDGSGGQDIDRMRIQGRRNLGGSGSRTIDLDGSTFSFAIRYKYTMSEYSS